MDAITEVAQWVFPLAGREVRLNATTLIMSWGVMGALAAFGLAVSRRPALVPGPLQSVAEVLVEVSRDLMAETLGKRGQRYFALVLTLFVFILISNWLGMIPFLAEPTKDLNTTLILAVVAFFAAQAAAIRAKGWRVYIKEYFQPFPFLFPLNVIGEAAKVVSMSFRLYGNVMGGSIIILVVSHLVYHLILPPFLNAFFGLFVGTVQAFVFAMLALTYIAVALQE